MATIAVIGADGAGKTTITRWLAESSLYPFKYIYMGINVQACNHALPTTFWAQRIKEWASKKQSAACLRNPRKPSRNDRRGFRDGKAWAVLRLLNALADEWYRQLVSWYYQWRGFIVIYDRHFVFDLWDDASPAHQPPLSSRIHIWCLNHFYPRPSLVIFLDAPPEVLYARKREWSVENLERKRQTFISVGKTLPNFFRIDATQPLDAVYAQVARTIEEICERDWGYHKIAHKRALSRSAPVTKSSA